MNKTDEKQTHAPPLEPLLNEVGAADFLGVAAGTLGNWRRAVPPSGPAYTTVGASVRYSQEDLRAFVAANRRDPQEMEPAL